MVSDIMGHPVYNVHFGHYPKDLSYINAVRKQVTYTMCIIHTTPYRHTKIVVTLSMVHFHPKKN